MTSLYESPAYKKRSTWKSLKMLRKCNNIMSWLAHLLKTEGLSVFLWRGMKQCLFTPSPVSACLYCLPVPGLTTNCPSDWPLTPSHNSPFPVTQSNFCTSQSGNAKLPLPSVLLVTCSASMLHAFKHFFYLRQANLFSDSWMWNITCKYFHLFSTVGRF